MLQYKRKKVEVRWFWNPPLNGYTIEDCEMMIKKILQEISKEKMKMEYRVE